MIAFLLWYLLASLLGLVAFPLVFKMLPGLPGRGYGFSRVAGLLIWGYVFWLFGSLNLVLNDSGGALIAFIALLGASIWVWQHGDTGSLSAWVRENRRHIFVVELLFLVGFAGWALVRAANPALFGTEKPMELAFINAILRSTELPPQDPWLSGYAISYYYFGYFITASLAKLSGIPGSVAFNLASALVFGLAAAGSYSLVYAILTTRSKDSAPASAAAGEDRSRSIQPFALLAPVFVLLLSNVVGLLEILHARGLLWIRGLDGAFVSPFWKWLDLQELSQPPVGQLSWLPRDFGTGAWWWWRASRVIQDYDLSGGWREVIDEFPQFSFLLGDLHPHVIAIPFVLFGIALALNLYLGGADGGFRIFRFHVRMSLPSFLFAAVIFGGLSFLNIWDFPTFLLLFSAAYALLQASRFGWSWARLWDFIGLTIALGLAGYLIYLPYYLSFTSQAGGILPNLVYPTRGAHLWIMFGLFLFPLFAYLIYSYRQWGNRRMLGKGALTAGGILLALFLGSLLLAGGILALPALDSLGLSGAQGFSFSELSGMFLGSLGTGSGDGLFGEALSRRIASPGGWLTLGALLALTIGLLWPKRKPLPDEPGADMNEAASPDRITLFILLLILLGTLIVLAPDFAFLRDQFGWRINTVFKLYYQAWLIWSIAVVVGIAIMAAGSRAWRIASYGGLTLILGIGLLYPLLGIWDRTQAFRPSGGLSLDGALASPYLSTEDRFAVDWLMGVPTGVLAEAVGGSYSEYGRISAHSGFPAVLGWPGHESQWRGGSQEMGSRESDIEILFNTPDWLEARRVLEQYNIRYIYIGPLERALYGVNETKFRENLRVVYDFGGVTIYEALLADG